MIEFTDKGIYCAKANVYIDPWVPVDKALITHAHSDHAYPGCQSYLATKLSESILRIRLGSEINLQTVSYGETIFINGVKFSFHPAGHIIGSAQIRIESDGEIWVVSGDYKLENDGISGNFEPVRCHSFITESTFALPIFKWKPQQQVYNEINEWWKKNKSEGKASILLGYPLGKSQRLLTNLDPSIEKIWTHGAVWNVNQALINDGAKLPDAPKITHDISKSDFEGSIILAPPSALTSPWIRKFKPYSSGLVSGWMALRGAKRRRPVDRGFILSDHADWSGLLQAIEATGAQKIVATHGYKSVFTRYLREKGFEAYEADTLWEGEVVEES